MNRQQRVRRQRVRQPIASEPAVNPRPLTALFRALALGLALGGAPLLAQTTGTEATESSPAATESATDKPAATPAPTAKSAPAQKSSGTGNSSPFDYRSSEEISEDMPVSFPVDI